MLTIIKDHPSPSTVGQLATRLNCNQSYLILPYYNNQKKKETTKKFKKAIAKTKEFSTPIVHKITHAIDNP